MPSASVGVGVAVEVGVSVGVGVVVSVAVGVGVSVALLALLPWARFGPIAAGKKLFGGGGVEEGSAPMRKAVASRATMAIDSQRLEVGRG
jgi:hypothetical protein